MTNAFDLSGPSVIAKDLDVIKGGITRSQLASRGVKKREASTGQNPGTIFGLSNKGDKQILPRKGRAPRP